MAVARVQLPDGRIARLEVPDGTEPAQIEQFVSSQFQGQQKPQETQAEPQKPGFFKGLATDAGNFVKSTAYSVPMGFGDEIRDGVAALYAGAVSPDLTVGQAYKAAREETQQEQSQMRQDSPLASLAGDITGAVLTGGAAAGTKAGTSLAASLRTGNPLTRIAKGIGTGAVSGAAYGAGSAESGDRLRGAIKGFIVGGVTGGAVPAIGSAVSGIKSTVAPKIEKPIADLAQRAKDFGIPLRLDQVSPTRVRNTVQKVSQELPGSGVDAAEAAQRASWNKALAKTIGQDSDDLGPATIKSFLKDNGELFENLVGDRPINIDPQDVNAISTLRGTVDKTLGITSRDSKILKDEIKAISTQLSESGVSGSKLAAIRSDLLKKSTGASVGKDVFSDIIEKIDEITAKNLTSEGVEELAKARQQYKYFKTIEPLLEKSTDGSINPTDLLNMVKSSKYIKASRSEIGDDDLIDLARIGKQFLQKKGGSDTAQKVGLMRLMENPLAQLAMLPAAPVNAGFQAANRSQKLIDLAIKNSGKATKQIARPASTILIPGASGGIAARP